MLKRKSLETKIVKLASDLIRIPSNTNELEPQTEIIDFVAGILNNFTIERFEKNGRPSLLVYNHDGVQTREFKVILNAHLDVVPGHKNQHMPYVKAGRLYGRGAYDMKAAAAVEILVFKELAKKLPYNLGLQLVTDEEFGGFDGTKHQLKNGIRAEFALVGEGTELGITTAAKGIYWLKIKVKGKPGHSAYPWRGENAVWKMHRFLSLLKVKYPELKENKWQSTVNIAHMSTPNTTYNIIPDECEVLLDIRYIPEDKDKVLKEIRDLAEFDFEELWLNEPVHYVSKNNPYINKLQLAVKKITAQKPQLLKKEGGSDMRHFSALGIPAVEFGPIGDNVHADDEWVSVSSLVDFYLSLERFLGQI